MPPDPFDAGAPSAVGEPARPRGVLFDLDGTLVDTNYLHTLTWWQALTQHRHVVPMAAVHRAVGMGSDQLLDHLLGSERDPGEDDAIVSAHDDAFAQWHRRVAPLPGARDLVAECARLGLAVALASSAAHSDLTAMLEVLDLDDVLDSATDADDADASKPAPDIIEAALERVGLDAADVVFVGDSVWDVESAGRAGVRCIAVECGGTSAAELLAAGAMETWRDPADLLANIARSALCRPAPPDS